MTTAPSPQTDLKKHAGGDACVGGGAGDAHGAGRAGRAEGGDAGSDPALPEPAAGDGGGFRAGRLAPIAAVARDGAVAHPPPRLVRSAAQSPARGEGVVERGSAVEDDDARVAPWRAEFEGVRAAYPSPSRCARLSSVRCAAQPFRERETGHNAA